jgi:hypothetical protein
MNKGLDHFGPIGKAGLAWLPAILIAGLGGWALASGYTSEPAEGQPAAAMSAALADPAPPAMAIDAFAKDPVVKPVTFESANSATSEAITPEQATPLDRLKISSQSWRRGGLGSNALITFTLRNSNDYAVGDIEISCAFSRRDGSHLTDRSRLIHDTVNMKSRKTFAQLHVGFVNVNASAAKCALVAANRI